MNYSWRVPEYVRITDVSPRDGLQNEPGAIPTPEKARLVELLCGTGVDEVEATSFVSAKWVPQLGDAKELMRLVAQRLRQARSVSRPGPAFSALVPNMQGFQGVLDVNRDAQHKLITKVSVFTAASETFAKKNTNATIAETLERFRPVIAAAHEQGLLVRAYVSCVIACPFEGPIAPAAVVGVSRRLAELGADELDLGDTIGAGTPETMAALLEAIDRELPIRTGHVPITLHLHDTFGRAAECVRTALEMGVRSFDGSVAGLGGCPYASTPGKRAPGNIATETLVRTVHAAGFETGVDLEKLAQAAAYARQIVSASRAAAEGGA
jgi:hydroxymethylglutaryl-CoA lyase